jgi:hypothetical protein
MEPDMFDRLTHSLFLGTSRRATLRGVVGATVLALMAPLASEEVGARRKRKKKTKKHRQKPPPPGCTPATCAAQGQACGAIPDGCGATLNCGSCPVCQTCSGGACVADAGQNQTVCAGSAPTTSICCNGTCCDGCCGVNDACGVCLVFVTSTPRFTANLGGLDGADQSCQARADAASRPGVYRAWLSAGGQSPSSRFRQSQQPYHLVDGTLIADNWTDLTTNLPLAHEINVTETGSPNVFDASWTHTTASGIEEATGNTCGGWLLTGAGDGNGDFGRTFDVDSRWTDQDASPCTGDHRLYCFQQG